MFENVVLEKIYYQETLRVLEERLILLVGISKHLQKFFYDHDNDRKQVVLQANKIFWGHQIFEDLQKI